MPTETQKHIEPTDGFPFTRVIKDDDDHIIGYDVIARHLTPMRARISDKLSLVAGLLSLYGLYQLTNIIVIEWYYIVLACMILPIAVPWLTRYVFYELLKKHTLIKFRGDHFQKCGTFRSKMFDRNVSHSFASYEHDWAETEERICRAFEALLPVIFTLKPFKRYIGASRSIAFEYMGQRQDLMLVYKKKPSRKILARLNACDQLMDGAAGNGRGEVLEPEAEWPQHGGSIASANI